MTGQYRYWNKMKYYESFKANLINIILEYSFSLLTTKQENGIHLKYKEISQSILSFKVKKFKFVDYSENKNDFSEKTASSNLRNLNYNGLKSYLFKLQKLILDTVSDELLKK